MRFKIDLLLDTDEIPKDKNRMVLSFFKSILEKYDEESFRYYYEEGSTKRKQFTFSMYMPNCKFNRETITIPDKKITIFFSTGDLKTGFIFANAFIKAKGKVITYLDLNMKVSNLFIYEDEQILEEVCIFKASSPIVVREHNRDTNKDWYHNLSEKEGMDLFLENLKIQILGDLPEARYDLDDLSVEIMRNKPVKVKHYSIEILSNLATLKIHAKTYILKYLYDTGIGSLKSGGFGMLSLV